MLLQAVLIAAFATPPAFAPGPGPDLRTVAESSDFQCTATSAEVRSLVDRLAATSDELTLVEFGRSFDDQPLQMLVAARPPIRVATEARASDKLRILLFGNIHAGEVCGKEAILMLAREIATVADHPALDDCVIMLAPNYNPDGNDEMAKDHRPGQVGPSCGMGQRPNKQGYDLNRDWMKLESPEARALVGVLTWWDPHLIVDTHTTNGSHHRYALTYAAPLNPAGFAPSIAFVRDELLPTVTERMRERTGYDSFFYGNFDRAHRTWSTYSAGPRFGGPYRGLRGQMSILSEAYAYISYEDRVRVTLAFLHEIVMYAREHATTIRTRHAEARAETTARGASPQPSDVVSIRHRLAAFDRPVVLHGYEMETPAQGRPRPTDQPRDYTVIHRGRFEPALSVRRPFAYLVPPGLDVVVEKLRQHGVKTRPFVGSAEVETYEVTAIERAPRAFQKHFAVRVDVSARIERRTFPTGTTLVTTAQPLGTLAVSLLEPQAEDGLTTWNFLDDHLAVDRDFPIVRVAQPHHLAPTVTP